ncbi:4Fe-4S ferredoxin [Anopheles sinensis]|uniref:4Fe-4S ferredoxin n=1 Tax=Anopheles sinensis TaxID=74873 RepID=A0A084W0E2_ANOSI|nr:4Fe-4S ferredoxin [Anopheles sinensis]
MSGRGEGEGENCIRFASPPPQLFQPEPYACLQLCMRKSTASHTYFFGGLEDIPDDDAGDLLVQLFHLDAQDTTTGCAWDGTAKANGEFVLPEGVPSREKTTCCPSSVLPFSGCILIFLLLFSSSFTKGAKGNISQPTMEWQKAITSAY